MKNSKTNLLITLTAIICIISINARPQSLIKESKPINVIINSQGNLEITPSKTSSKTDLDFFLGKWRVHHKKRMTKPNGSAKWIVYEGTSDDKKMLNGIGHRYYNISTIDGVTYESINLAFFNPKTKLWSLYRADSQNGVMNYENPSVGSFENNIGTFYCKCKDRLNGKSIIIMEQWDKTNPDKILIDRAVSKDTGKTWIWTAYMRKSRVVQNKEELLNKLLTIDRALPIPELKFDENGELIIKASATSSNDDFDLLTGEWKMYHHKLKERFTHSNEWIYLESTDENFGTMLNGLGNSDLYTATFNGEHFEGYTIRLFNPKTKLWSLYWVPSNTGVLDPPVAGSFENGVGHFFGKDIVQGREVIVLFRWDFRDRKYPVWSQAFSTDNGKTWEWNWINVSYRLKK